jgi:hypothetical protein
MSDPNIVNLENNGTLEYDADDGVIRYRDCQGNCEGIWEPGEPEYEHYRGFFSNLPSVPMTCCECGRQMRIEENGVSHHLTEDDEIDFDADANHVAFADDGYSLA